MSHFTTIQTQIKDLDVLADVCRELGVELQSDIAVDPSGESSGRL